MSNLYRDGNWIVAPLEGAEFPNRCVKTNAEVSRADFKVVSDLFPRQILVPQTRGEKATEIISTILIGRGMTELASITQKKRLTFHVGLADDARGKLKKLKLFSLLSFVVAVLMPILIGFIAGADNSTAMGMGVGLFGLFLVCGIVLFAFASMGALNVARSDGCFVWLNGGGQEFLDSLPPSPMVWDGNEFVDRD